MMTTLLFWKFGKHVQESKRLLIYAEDVLSQLGKNHMSNSDDIIFDDFDEETKQLILTRNELLYLSDSVTILLEHASEQGKMHIPARQLMPSAGVPVPVELIQTIGLGFVSLTDENNSDETATINVTLADLYLLRECCQSFVKINNEFVGFNLLKKIYNLILEEAVLERKFINKITTGLNLDLNTVSQSDMLDQVIEQLIKDKKHDNPNTAT